MDTVVLTMSNALPPGNYTITVKNGTDGNTLLDNCSNSMAVGENISVCYSCSANAYGQYETCWLCTG